MISLIRQYIEYEGKDHSIAQNFLYYFLIPWISGFLVAYYNPGFFKETSSDVISGIMGINAIVLVIFGLTINIQNGKSVICEIENTDQDKGKELVAKRIKLEFISEKLKLMKDAFNTAILAQGIFLVPTIVLIILAKAYGKYEITFLAVYMTVVCIEIVMILLSRFPYLNTFRDKT